MASCTIIVQKGCASNCQILPGFVCQVHGPTGLRDTSCALCPRDTYFIGKTIYFIGKTIYFIGKTISYTKSPYHIYTFISIYYYFTACTPPQS